jgi:hypothetical protein
MTFAISIDNNFDPAQTLEVGTDYTIRVWNSDTSLVGTSFWVGIDWSGSDIIICLPAFELNGSWAYAECQFTPDTAMSFGELLAICNGVVSDKIVVTIEEAGDTTDPAISITSPLDFSTVTSPDVLVEGTASDNVGVDYVNVWVGSGSPQRASGITSWSKSVTLAEGLNVIHASATDTSGNTKYTSIDVTYAPPVSFTDVTFKARDPTIRFRGLRLFVVVQLRISVQMVKPHCICLSEAPKQPQHTSIQIFTLASIALKRSRLRRGLSSPSRFFTLLRRF